MNITYEKLNKIANSIESNRTPYLGIWQWASLFAGSQNPLKNSTQIGEVFKGDESTPSDKKSALDPSTINLFDTAAQFYSGIFFPENDPFSARIKDEEDEAHKEVFEAINKEMNRQMRMKATNFQDAKERSYYDYIVLGTKALMVTANPNPEYAFWVNNFSVDNMAFNANRDIFVLGFQWTADQIVSQLTGQEFKEEKLPERILKAYKDFDFQTEFKVRSILMKNRDFKNGSVGKNGMKYMGFWLVDGINEIIKTDYYKECPISESLYKIKTGEIYGRSPLIDRKNGFEIYDGIMYMITNNIAKIGDPATGYFDVGAIGYEYDTTPGSMQPFNQGLLGGAAPTFKLQDAGDVTPAVSYLQPRIYEALRAAYGVDAMVDIMTQKRAMTATEVMTVENLRNKILAPKIRREVSELLSFKVRIFLMTARWMAANGMISEEDLQFIEQNRTQWDITENSSVERIIQTENMTQYQSELNLIAAAQTVSPKLAAAVDLYDSTQKALQSGLIQLVPKRQYQSNVAQQEQMAMLQALPQKQVSTTEENPEE